MATGANGHPAGTWVECPRDAWQAMPRPIPSETKARHVQNLIDAGFARIDVGSFVSPRAVPQMADTEEVLALLDPPPEVELLGIVANMRGVERAAAADGVRAIGYPLSVNETFQQRNTGRSIDASWRLVEELVAEAPGAGLELVVYLSMGFGNPYGDPWRPADTAKAVARLRDLGVQRIALADTTGSADAGIVADVLDAVTVPAGDLGLHLHARPEAWEPLVRAGVAHGVRWFEGALGGVGGCPFADDALVGNLPTEAVLPYLRDRGRDAGVMLDRLPELRDEAAAIAARYG